jgi:hypothetical protein
MCNGKSFRIEPQTAEFKTSGQGLAAVADAKDRVALNDFNGGRSVTSRREDGRIHKRRPAARTAQRTVGPSGSRPTA